MTDSQEPILKFCPGCGAEIKWNKDIQFCMVCGMYLIPFIPKDKIQEWLGVSMTSEEIEELYRKKPVHEQPITASRGYSVMHSFSYRTKRPWKWGAALGVPLLSVIAKLIGSVVILLIYILIVVDDFAALDINAFLSEHIVPIYIIEFVTQWFFLLVPYLFTAIYFPYKAPRKERLESLGIPFGLKSKRWLVDIGIGVGAAILMTVLVYGLQWVSAYLTEWIFNIPADYFLGSDSGIDLGLPTTLTFTIIYIVFMVISIGPSEEVLFRGFCQKGLQDSFKNPKTGKTMGLIITAVYFSLFHIFQYFLIGDLSIGIPLFFFSFIPYFSLSLVLGFLYMFRKNLISAVTAHALYNIIQFLIYVIVLA